MVDIAGVHLQVHYRATYRVMDKQTRWRATFHWGKEEIRQEGQLLDGQSTYPTSRTRLHIFLQRYIESMPWSEEFGTQIR
ncbi:hypothetical protein [Dyella sp. 2YAF14]|uniref:hypothetical protein n=1 Tax=Dyella sp. 2YAF14 TaxID=3233025 RepID=UPI003F92E27B